MHAHRNLDLTMALFNVTLHDRSLRYSPDGKRK